MDGKKVMSEDESAQAVQEHLDDVKFALPPGRQHHARRLVAICNKLGIPATAHNALHANYILEKLGVAPFEGDEYPKAAPQVRGERGKLVDPVYPDGHPKAGAAVIFANAEEEAAYTKDGGRDAARLARAK